MSEKQSLRELYEESRHEGANNGEGRDADIHAFRMMAVVVSLILTWVVYASIPLTHAGAAVHYNNMELANSALHKGMLKEYRDEATARLSMDFSRILTPVALETTEVMRHVAKECLPEEVPEYVMPGRGAYKAYDMATDYLVCAMQKQAHRFCHPAERARLIEQLLQYRDRRQNVLAIENSRNAMMKNRAAQQQLAMMQSIAATSGQKIPTPPEPVGDEINPRVMSNLAHLVANGLMSRSDFGFMGLYLPEEYVPALMTEKTAATCGY